MDVHGELRRERARQIQSRPGRSAATTTDRQVAATTAFPAPAWCRATAAAIATVSHEAPATSPIAEMFPAVAVLDDELDCPRNGGLLLGCAVVGPACEDAGRDPLNRVIRAEEHRPTTKEARLILAAPR